ncbi:MAG: carbonic anhydrase, partial [Tardiphaga sp.]
LSPGDFIGKWISILAPALETTPRAAGEQEQDFLTRLEQAAVRRSLDNLMTFPCISILAERGTLSLHGAYFGVARGSLSILDQASGDFRVAGVTA